MAEIKHINKVVYGGKTLIDLTGDTATADKVLKDLTFHDKTGATVTGTCTFDVDSGDATVAVAEMLAGKTAYARGTKLTGTMGSTMGLEKFRFRLLNRLRSFLRTFVMELLS